MADSLSEDRERGGARAERPGARPARPRSGMAKDVTRHAEISRDEEWRLLACGVDTLDLSACVNWGKVWGSLSNELETGRQNAQENNKPMPWRETQLGPCLVCPGGKPPMFRYHLQVSGFHLFVGINRDADKSPNVYVSLNAKALWSQGVTAAVESVETLLEELGAEIKTVKPSRCDLCADFLMPKGIRLELLMHHGVPKNIFTSHILQGAELETYYIGSRKGSIRGRVYDKTKEVLKNRKHWFMEVWKVEDCKDVWRVEFQFRRQALKAYGVETVGDLVDGLAGIWLDTTRNWYSLRLLDSKNTTRRSFHPWWVAVQECAEQFGPLCEMKRDFTRSCRADSDYYVARAANLLLGYAAIAGLPNLDDAVWEESDQIQKRWADRDFEEAYILKVVELNESVKGDSREYEDEVPF